MKTRQSLIALLFLLSACGSGGEGASESVAEGAAGAPGEAPTLQPGQWEVTTEILRMKVPGMPAGMTPPMPGAQKISLCLTPEEARAPGADFITGSGPAGGCRSENLSMRGGRIEGTIRCDMEGRPMQAQIEGEFAPQSYRMDQKISAQIEGRTMDMEMRTSGRRIGECTSPA